MSQLIQESAREIPVIADCDVCVLGGSCTGVFAAVRAARLGAKVVLVEKAGALGGVATLSLVNVWHSPKDTVFERQIIGGLTLELIARLKKRGSVTERDRSPHWAWAFNPWEMQIELDELVQESAITPMLHTMFVAAIAGAEQVEAIIVEGKSGRQAIRAKMFIDATGDGDVCQRLGSPTYQAGHFQPATTCATFAGWDSVRGTNLSELFRKHGSEFNLPEGFAWGADLPGAGSYMLAGTRVYHENCAESQGLTRAEIEGRRQVRAIMDTIRKYVPGQNITLQGLPARVGIRETRHVRCQYQLTGTDVLTGRRFDDAIANGSYRVDVHHQDKPGITFMYLDGRQEWVRPGLPSEVSQWRQPVAVDPTFYQIPYRSMVPGTYRNLLVAGRMIDADAMAHAAIRVMVNMNQTGEAAGVAAVLAMKSTGDVRTIDTRNLRQMLADGQSVMI